MNSYVPTSKNKAMVTYKYNKRYLNPFEKEEFDKIISLGQLYNHLCMHVSTRLCKTECIKLIYKRLALKANSSIVIFDPHRDLARQCAKMINGNKELKIFFYSKTNEEKK